MKTDFFLISQFTVAFHLYVMTNQNFIVQTLHDKLQVKQEYVPATSVLHTSQKWVVNITDSY